VYFNGNGTITQETSVKPDTSTYALKVTATATSADNSVYQLVEQLNMEQFRGKVVTLSVKVAGTATLAPAIGLAYSTTANDTLTNTSTGIGATIVANPTINASTFVTYISQFTVPTTAKTLRIQLGSGTMANTNVLYWAEAQLEIGSTATAFSRAGGTIQGELAACQRYYWQSPSTVAYTPYGFGLWISATTFQALVKLPVSMRIIPTLATSNALAANGATSSALTSISVVGAQSSVDSAYVSGNGTGTTNNPAVLANNNNSGGYLGLTAEL
jgi:hypothetical protein